MRFEKFDPTDKRYKSTRDLPESVQFRFENVDGGFVRKEVLEYENRLARRVEEASRYGVSRSAGELSEEDAKRTDADITAEVSEQIGRIEASSETTLSEETRANIYRNTAPSTYLTANEYNQRAIEQGLYRNELLRKLCDRIIRMPEEEFGTLSVEEKRKMLEDISSFDQFIHDTAKTATLHEASKRLLESYRTGDELTTMHENAHTAILNAFSPSKLIETNDDWSEYPDDRKIAVWKNIADVLSSQYDLDRFPVIPVDNASDDNESLASFSEDGKLLISMPKMRGKSFLRTLNVISHEMAHAHQKKLATSDESKLPDTLQEDARWFALDAKLERVYGRDFYHENYRLMSKEQDAYKAGDAMELAMNEKIAATRKEWARHLDERGFPPLMEISNNYQISLIAKDILGTGYALSGNNLMKILEDERLILESDSAQLFRGKAPDGCRRSIAESVKMMQKARKVLEESADR